MVASTSAWCGWPRLLAIGVLCLATSAAAQPAPPEPATPPAPGAAPASETTAQPVETDPVDAAAQAEGSIALQETTRESMFAEDEGELLPWFASVLWDHLYNSAGLVRGTGQTFNPTFGWDVLLTGGYNFSRDTKLSLVVPISLELTDSDSTARRQQLLLGDVGLDLMHTFLRLAPEAKQSLKLAAGGRLLLPTSLLSQAATTVVATRVRLAGEYTFERVLHGLLTAAELRYTRRWNRSETGVLDQSFPCTLGSADPSDSCTHMGASNPRDAFMLIAGVNLAFAERWVVGLEASLAWGRAHSLGEDSIAIESGAVNIGDTSATHWRNTRLIEVTLGYEFAPWFSLLALLANDFTERGPSGRYRAPFQPYETSVGARLVVSFDELYKSTRTHAGD